MLLWKSHIAFPPGLLKEVIKGVKQPAFHDPCLNIYTTYLKSIDSPLGDDLVRYYDPLMEKITKKAGLYHRSTYRWQLWVQLYDKPTSHHNVHDHFSGNEFLSWVHFLKTTKKSKFIFLDSDGEGTYLEESDNMFIVFPSWSLHQVLPLTEQNEERLIMAGNISLDFLRGSGSNCSYSVERSPGSKTWRRC